jgi:hypothetical protein
MPNKHQNAPQGTATHRKAPRGSARLRKTPQNAPQQIAKHARHRKTPQNAAMQQAVLQQPVLTRIDPHQPTPHCFTLH